MPAARLALVALVVVAALAAPASADQVSDLIGVIERKPGNVEREVWRDQRREAARKLGELGDRRAVAVLIRVAADEQFDAIAEIAIVALGKLGDASAAPTLRKIAADASRDRYVRDQASAALRRLSAAQKPVAPVAAPAVAPAPAPVVARQKPRPFTSPSPSPSPSTTTSTSTSTSTSTTTSPSASTDASTSTSTSTSTEASTVAAPEMTDGDLAAVDRMTLAIGGARLGWQSVRNTRAIDGDLAADIESTRERTTRGTRWGARAAIAGGAIDVEGPGSLARSVLASFGLDGEARFYLGGSKAYVLGAGAGAMSLTHQKIVRPGDTPDTATSRFGADLEGMLGGGAGRVLEVGEALRVRRIELALRQAGALGRPITPDLADRLLTAWWELRAELGFQRRLTTTVAILREAGVLLGEPDAGLTYRLLEILRDGLLDHRVAGLDIRAGVVGSYLVRDEELGALDGFVTSLAAAARYGEQSADGTRELVGDAAARYRVLAADGDPSPWAVSAGATLRRFAYADTFDPIGALELGARVGASSDGADDDELASMVEVSAGWLFVPRRASRFRVSATGRLEADEVFIGAALELAHGLLDASTVSPSVYSAL